jgi:hypothetical protein
MDLPVSFRRFKWNIQLFSAKNAINKPKGKANILNLAVAIQQPVQRLRM